MASGVRKDLRSIAASVPALRIGDEPGVVGVRSQSRASGRSGWATSGRAKGRQGRTKGPTTGPPSRPSRATRAADWRSRRPSRRTRASRPRSRGRRHGCRVDGSPGSEPPLRLGRRPVDTGTASRRGGPASFAGTSQIRFGGSVAGATLSARQRSPGALFDCPESSTGRARAQSRASPATEPAASTRRRAGLGPEPDEHVGDDRRPIRLVQRFVAKQVDRRSRQGSRRVLVEPPGRSCRHCVGHERRD